MVAGQPTAGVGRQRQQTLRVESAQPGARPDLHRTPGRRQRYSSVVDIVCPPIGTLVFSRFVVVVVVVGSDRLVAAPPRRVGQRRRYGRPLHPLLEHADGPADAVRRHGLAGVQPGLVQTLVRTGVDARLLAEPDPHLEVSVPHPGTHTLGTH